MESPWVLRLQHLIWGDTAQPVTAGGTQQLKWSRIRLLSFWRLTKQKDTDTQFTKRKQGTDNTNKYFSLERRKIGDIYQTVVFTSPEIPWTNIGLAKSFVLLANPVLWVPPWGWGTLVPAYAPGKKPRYPSSSTGLGFTHGSLTHLK